MNPLMMQGGYPIHAKKKGHIYTVFVDLTTNMPAPIAGDGQPAGTLAQTLREEEFVATYPPPLFQHVIHDDPGSGMQATVVRTEKIRRAAALELKEGQDKMQSTDTTGPVSEHMNKELEMTKALEHMKLLFAQYKVAEGGTKDALKLEVEHAAKAYMMVWPDIEEQLNIMRNGLKAKPFTLDE